MEKVPIGNATLYHADCLEVLPLLDGVDAVAGATISSNAAMDAVQKAIDAFSTVKGA